MMKKTGFLKFSFMASVMVMGMYSSGAMADIASKSYVAQQIADAVKPVQQINDDLATLQGVIGETSMFGNRTIIGEIDDLRKSATGSDSKVGNLDDLKTDEKTTVVGAINETNDKIGDLSKIDEGIDSVADALSSTKYMFEQLTGVIEGAWEAVGEPSNLLTTAKANVVEAVNENRTNIGDMG
ncbi:hypothetical protein HDR63_03890, partial [bacterium]|nr:hypothetical protein [bacterium]